MRIEIRKSKFEIRTALLCASMLAAVMLIAAGAAQAQQKTYAITGAKIYTMAGPPIENGTIVIRDGKIAAVGAGVSVPGGAQVINARGMHVYPGFFDAAGQMGLREIDSVPATVDFSEIGDFNPQLVASAAVHPASEHIPVGRAAGVTHVLTVPGLGSRIGGQASLIHLNGWVTEEMLLRKSAAMAITWPSMSAPRGFGGFGGGGGGRPRPFSEIKQEYERRVSELEDWLDRARHYAQAMEKGSKEKFDRDLKLEALVPVVKGEMPVLMQANDDRDIKNAVEFCEKQKLKMILAGGRQAWKVKDLLKQKNIPVILSPVQTLPQSEDEPYDKPYSAPGELAAAGVKIAFGSFTGNNSAVEAHTVMYEAGQAVAFGLPHETALAALTRAPAEMFGVAGQVGTIEVGKLANITVTTGDALELKNEVRYVFIEGQLTSLDNRHKQLYEKYRARP